MVEIVYNAVRSGSLYKTGYVWSLITVVESDYSAVHTASLYKANYVWSLTTVVEIVYSAIRTGSLYKADYVSSLKDQYYCVKNTDMRRLTTVLPSENCVIGRFRCCANVIQCTYTNPDSTV